MRDDVLLEAFAKRGDAEAFRQLVERYTPVVYAAARRQIRDEHMAEDVTQAVFVLLARKAASIRAGETLPAWLISAARLCSLATVREEVRRKAREARFAAAALTIDTSHPADSERQMAVDANAVEKAVDAALCELPEKDRTVVVLRYLQGKSQREAAAAMGVSEGAAAQRLARAMERLRKLFSSRGIVLSTVASTELALQQACANAAVAVPPAGLALAAADAALSTSGGASSIAHTIANVVLDSWQRKATATLLAASLGALVMLALIGVAAAFSMRGTATTDVATKVVSPPLATGPTVAEPRIRVGIYVSAATAVPRPPRDNAWYKMFEIAGDLKNESDMDVVPLVEPGTVDEPHQKRLLDVYFPGKTPIDVTDTAALQTLDAIVATGVHEPPQQALISIDAAVRGGTGLYIRRCLGGHGAQGDTPVAIRLRGLATKMPEGTVRAPKDLQELVVLTGHPILGTLTPTSLKKPMMRHVAGVWGTLPPGATPLIRLKDVRSLAPEDKSATDGAPSSAARATFTSKDTAGDVVWLSQLGKGRVVNANFDMRTWPEIQQATDNRFTARVVKWLAGRPVE